MVDDHTVEVPPAPHMVVVRNDDRAGMIGVVGTILGEAASPSPRWRSDRAPRAATAMMVISTVGSTPDAVVDQLRGDEGILDIHRVSL